jgi:hypothetical protein
MASVTTPRSSSMSARCSAANEALDSPDASRSSSVCSRSAAGWSRNGASVDVGNHWAEPNRARGSVPRAPGSGASAQVQAALGGGGRVGEAGRGSPLARSVCEGAGIEAGARCGTLGDAGRGVEASHDERQRRRAARARTARRIEFFMAPSTVAGVRRCAWRRGRADAGSTRGPAAGFHRVLSEGLLATHFKRPATFTQQAGQAGQAGH